MNNIIGHVDQMPTLSKNGLNLSIDNLKHIFLGLVPNSSHLLSTCIYALESITCQTRPSLNFFHDAIPKVWIWPMNDKNVPTRMYDWEVT